MRHDIRWTARKIAQRLQLIAPLVYQQRQPIPPLRYVRLNKPTDEPPLEPDEARGKVIKPGKYWSAPRTNFVLYGEFSIAPDWETGLPVALHFALGKAGDFSHPEALVYVDGQPYAATDRHHQEILLDNAWRDGQPHHIALHGWTGLMSGLDMKGEGSLLMGENAVVSIHQPARDFFITARTALEVAEHLGDEHPAKWQLLNALDAAFKQLDTREPFGPAFYDSLKPAHEKLRKGIAKAGPPLDTKIHAVGHAHIDVAWLWTLGQTRRKAGRTFHNVLRLMEQFPGYYFTQSQPQLYEYVRQDYPALFGAIKERIIDGRWEPIGGMWVEADCNISGPESLARQFLLGRSFFRQHFGKKAESPVLWLPDVFGYAWALPQLIKKAGLEYFFTIKIGWNQYNRMPFDRFWWQGLDGTRVLTSFSTAPEPGVDEARGTYNSDMKPASMLRAWQDEQQKETLREIIVSYGWGDGGGGPTREMLENAHEMKKFPALPQVQPGKVIDYFKALEKHGNELPTWNGELYLEYHRGTYTTQSRNKRANRKSEFLLHDAEFLAAYAALLDDEYEYPGEQFRRAWELVCLNQFHDIVPGSSIHEVYTESLAQYAQVRTIAETIRDEALKTLAAVTGGDVLVVNPTAFTRDALVFWPRQLPQREMLTRPDDTPVPMQPTANGTWLAVGEIDGYSILPLSVVEGKAPEFKSELNISPKLIENGLIRIDLNQAGDIVRILDKRVPRDAAVKDAISNQLQAFEDRPLNWDAWDIDIFYDDKMWTSEPATSVEVIESGPLRATLQIKRRILNSEYTQTISLAYNSPRLDFDTSIDWREQHILLKAAFPVDILTPRATYEIQWGNVERPTHRNTSWDWARFETCAQKWVDLSEGDYGVSLLNDCKYGHDVQGNVMRLSLLRSPTSPDPAADQGTHRFSYSFFPHLGNWNEATIGAAYALNDPLIAFTTYAKNSPSPQVLDSLFSLNRPNAVIETIKQAEDGNGFIVRLYESQRQRGYVTLSTGFDIKAVKVTNLIEDDESTIEVIDNKARFMLKPYEILTLRVIPLQKK
jgi:alpha-mannosidase